MHRLRAICLAAILNGIAAGLVGLDARADDPPPERSTLATLKEKIAAMQQRLLHTGGERDRLADELRATEMAAAAIQQSIAAAQADMAQLDRELAALTARRRQLQSAHRTQRARLATELAIAYRLGRQAPIKLLFNLENPQDVSRNLKYYDYFLAARRDKLNHYRHTLTELAGVSASIQRKQTALVDRQQKLQREQAQHRVQQNERQRLVAAMNGQLQTEKSRLAKATAESARLEEVVKTIAARQRKAAAASRRQADARQLHAKLAPQPPPTDANSAKVAKPSPSSRAEPAEPEPLPGLEMTGSFARQRGKLSWPTLGTVVHRFGAPRAQKLTWQGWLVQGADGAPVRAVFPGQVVFSDYLRGHGLLIILDHGDGYLSLYGRNQRLLKQTGDRVRAGDAIATVGNTGGAERSALYFEIRHQGRAIDPAPWLRTQG